MPVFAFTLARSQSQLPIALKINAFLNKGPEGRINEMKWYSAWHFEPLHQHKGCYQDQALPPQIGPFHIHASHLEILISVYFNNLGCSPIKNTKH